MINQVGLLGDKYTMEMKNLFVGRCSFLMLLIIMTYNIGLAQNDSSNTDKRNKIRLYASTGGILGRAAYFNVITNFMEKWFIGQTQIQNDNQLKGMFGLGMEYKLSGRFRSSIGIRSSGFLNMTQYDYTDNVDISLSKGSGMSATLIDVPITLDYIIPVTSELRFIPNLIMGGLYTYSRALATYQTGFDDGLGNYKLYKVELMYQAKNSIVPFVGAGFALEYQIKKHAFRIGFQGQYPLQKNYRFKQEYIKINSATGENVYHDRPLGWDRTSNFRVSLSYYFGRFY